jgi:hypothetical protein
VELTVALINRLHYVIKWNAGSGRTSTNLKKAANYEVATVKIYVDFFTSMTYSNFK